MDTKLAVAKLDEHNFLEWRRDMRWYLIAKKLWDPESEGEVEASLDLQSLAQIGLHVELRATVQFVTELARTI